MPLKDRQARNKYSREWMRAHYIPGSKKRTESQKARRRLGPDLDERMFVRMPDGNIETMNEEFK